MKRVHLPPQALKQELPRAHLLERLAGAQDLKLIVLLAPSGFGKTTLLAQYARWTPHQTLWLTLQQDDADPVMLRESFRMVLAGLGLTLPAEAHLRQMAQLLNGLPDNLHIILDGVQHLGQDAGWELDAFLDTLHEGHQVLLSTYADPPIRLARHLARGNALLLGADQLAFTPEETHLYLQARHYPGDPLHAHQTLQGWAAGLALISSEASLYYQPTDLILETLGAIGPPLREHLPEAAVLDVWDPQIAGAIGSQLPAGWLDQLRKLGLPLSPIGGGRFLPHRLLTEALEQELRKTPQRHQQLHTQMGHWHQQQGQNLQALQHFVRARQDTLAIGLAGQLVDRYTQRGEQLLVCRVLETFPLERLPDALKVQLAVAWLETGNTQAGEQLLNGLRHLDSPQVLYNLGRMHGRKGRQEDHLHQLQHAESSLQRFPDEVRLHWLKAHALLNLNSPAEALQAAGQATKLAETQQQTVEVALGLHLEACCLQALGDAAGQLQALKQALQLLQSLNMPSRTLVVLNDLADLQRQLGQHHQARELLEQALPLARDEHSSTLPLLQETLGETLLALGEVEASIDTLQQAVQQASDLQQLALACRIRLTLADALLGTGQLEQAQQQLEACLPLPEKYQQRMQFLQGLLAHRRQDTQAAQQLLSALPFPPGSAEHLRIQLHLADLQKSPLAGQSLLPLERLVQDHPARSLLHLDRLALGPLLRKLRVPLPQSHLPEKAVLQIHTLGKLQVHTSRGILHLPFAKAGELLVWLALHGPAARERIVDALWDGSREERHVGYFKVAVRRLRGVLMEHHPQLENPLPFENGLYAISPDLQVQLDLQELEHLPLDEVPAYPGEFLPGVDTLWVEEKRAQVQEGVVQRCLQVAQHTQHQQPEVALQAYQQALSLDPLSPTIHQDLIRLHHRLGNTQLARRVYQHYQRVIQQELGDHPEPFEQLIL